MEQPNFKAMNRLSLNLQENLRIIEQHLEKTDCEIFAIIDDRLTCSFLNEPVTEKIIFERKFHPEADRLLKETRAQINLLCEMLGLHHSSYESDFKKWIQEAKNIALTGLSISSCEKDE
jgi:hypothetical protein